MVWTLVGVLTWRGAWRIAAAVPFVAVGVYAGVVLVPDCMKDPSAHNLLPFELGFLFWWSLPYIAVLALIRHASREPERQDDAR